MSNGLIVHLVKDKWVMLFSADAIELLQALLCELYASALGEHLNHRKLEALVWHRF